jgi:hypothetical protein
MKKQNSVPNIVYLAILTAITVIFWIFFSVYRVFSNEPTPSVDTSIMEPLSPVFSLETMDQIGQRVYFKEGEIPQTIIASPNPSESASPTAAPTPSPLESAIPTASASASPTSSPEVSPSPTAASQGI